MTASVNPDWENLIGHVRLADTGEVVTISADDQQVVVALYAIQESEPGDDTEVLPAPVIVCTPSEAEVLGGLVTLAAVHAFNGQRPPARDPER